MIKLLDYPLLVFLVAYVLLMSSVWVGAKVLRRLHAMEEVAFPDFGFVLTATLTLLTLLIGFTFSMSTGRYDQRKNLEAAEANAIGTEYLRVDMLPEADAARARTLLKQYVDQRVLFYTTRDPAAISRINDRTSQLQAQLWSTVSSVERASLIPAAVLALSGMNDVLDSQGFSQAAWWNRIPVSAWVLMLVIGVCCALMIGYCARSPHSERVLLHVLPLIISIAFFLIADIDSPRSGIIRVQPQNLISVAESLRGTTMDAGGLRQQR